MDTWLKENKCDLDNLAQRFGLPPRTVKEAAEIVFKDAKDPNTPDVRAIQVGWRIRNKAVEMLRAQGRQPNPVDRAGMRLREELNAAREEIRSLKKQMDDYLALTPQTVTVEKVVEVVKTVEVPVEVVKEIRVEIPVEKIVEKIVYVEKEKKPVPLWLKIITLWWVR